MTSAHGRSPNRRIDRPDDGIKPNPAIGIAPDPDSEGIRQAK
jgi:hypothetical protein